MPEINNTNTKPSATPTESDLLKKRIAELEAALAVKNSGPTAGYFISEETGVIVVRGFTKKWPLSIYNNHIPTLIKLFTGKDMTPDMPIAKFLEKNKALLPVKGESEEAAKTKQMLRKADTSGVVSHPKNSEVAA